MKVLYVGLLICLCRTTLSLSDISHLTMNCTSENDEHLQNCKTDPCIWNISLTKCNSLRYECSEMTEKEDGLVCSSLEECGLANKTDFLERLVGDILCKPSKKNLDCFAVLLCKHLKYLCEEEEYCGMRPIISHQSNKEYHCKFTHSLTKCIQENEIFPVKGELKCTVTQGKNVWEVKEHQQCSSVPNESYTGAVLGSVLALVVVSFLGYIIYIGRRNGWNTLCACRNCQGSSVTNPQPGSSVTNPQPGSSATNPQPGSSVTNPQPCAPVNNPPPGVEFTPPEKVHLLQGIPKEHGDDKNGDSEI